MTDRNAETRMTTLEQVQLTLRDIGRAAEKAEAADGETGKILREEYLDAALRRAEELVEHLERWRGGEVVRRRKLLDELTAAALRYGEQ